jgi:hypothetical protein
MAAALAVRGVPAGHIRHDATSFDTIGNWRSAQALLPPVALPELSPEPLLISAPLHLLRIRYITGGAGTPAPTADVAQALGRRGAAIWYDVHREWVAWAAMILIPADQHRRWVKRWRDFWDG